MPSLSAEPTAAAGREAADTGRQLLLGYLADKRHGDTALSNSAAEFMLCQAFANEVALLQKAGGSEDQQASLLVSYRAQLSALRRPASSSLTEGAGCKRFLAGSFFKCFQE